MLVGEQPELVALGGVEGLHVGLEHLQQLVHVYKDCILVVELGGLCEELIVEEPDSELVSVFLRANVLELQEHVHQALKVY